MDTLNEVFPEVNSGIMPFGSRVLVQIRRPEKKTKHGIILVDESVQAAKHSTQIAKVVAMGPVAFKNRSTMAPWPEGAWCKVGEYVRTPMFGGDRFSRKHEREEILFVIFNDIDIIGKVTDDPASILTFI